MAVVATEGASAATSVSAAAGPSAAVVGLAPASSTTTGATEMVVVGAPCITVMKVVNLETTVSFVMVVTTMG